MSEIKKKTWPELFKKVKSGQKKFDLRVADFNIKKGDILVLEEWNPKLKKYTGQKIKKKVNYVLAFKLDSFGQKKEIEEKGFYIIQF